MLSLYSSYSSVQTKEFLEKVVKMQTLLQKFPLPATPYQGTFFTIQPLMKWLQENNSNT